MIYLSYVLVFSLQMVYLARYMIHITAWALTFAFFSCRRQTTILLS